MDHAEASRIERVINRELGERFADGAVLRAVLLQPDDDPAIEPGQLLVRVFIPAPGERAQYEETLAAFQEAHRSRLKTFRRELSARLPEARRLEFTFDDPDPATPRIELPDNGEPMSGRDIVTTALSLLRENYVFPEVADRAATAVETRLAAGEYDDLDEPALAERLTGDLNEICDDKHLRVWAPRGPGRRPGPGGPGPGPGPGGPGRDRPGEHGPRTPREEPDDHESRVLAMRRMGRLDNFGIHRVERLDGNIGYLDLRRVPVPAIAGPAMAAAMELVAGTYALIIDLRRNGGGAPDGVVFWCSYLFDERPTHLNDIFRADTGETRQFWALPYVPGPRYLERPVYVLTSERTFSGGEDFAYTLQALGRAEVIGETTGGGAHPTRVFPISRAVNIAVPFARSVNPVTGTNWQGTGVVPDVAAPEAEARDVAYAKALRHVLAMEDVPPPIEDEARSALDALPASE
jgi:Peptidase family S41/N-terminal domain of Peptidase_S41 in eukaryotic IRBP